MVGRGGDRPLVGLQNLDRTSALSGSSAPRQRRGRKAEIGVSAISGASSGRIGPLADRL